MEALLLTAAVFIVVTQMMSFIGPKLQTTILKPLADKMEDTIRFGFAKEEGTINPIDPEEVEGAHPFARRRNKPLHF